MPVILEAGLEVLQSASLEESKNLEILLVEFHTDRWLGFVYCSGFCVGFGKGNSDKSENCDFVSVLVSLYKRTI